MPGVYNGYEISYLIVKYIFENMNEDKIRKIITNTSYTKSIENELYDNAIKYYSNLYN